MSEAKHTPGPWYAHEIDDYLGLYTQPPITYMGKPLKIVVDNNPNEKWGGAVNLMVVLGNHPDAHLIAAAPDLLEAAQAVLAEFTDHHNWACLGSGECKKDGGYTCQECVMLKLKELLQPAIRKAVGE